MLIVYKCYQLRLLWSIVYACVITTTFIKTNLGKIREKVCAKLLLTPPGSEAILVAEKWPKHYQCTVFENHRKSLIQYCERSELRLHFDDKNWWKMPKLKNSNETFLWFSNNVYQWRNALIFRFTIKWKFHAKCSECCNWGLISEECNEMWHAFHFLFLS